MTGRICAAACEVIWGEVTCEELARRASLDATRLQAGGRMRWGTNRSAIRRTRCLRCGS